MCLGSIAGVDGEETGLHRGGRDLQCRQTAAPAARARALSRHLLSSPKMLLQLCPPAQLSSAGALQQRQLQPPFALSSTSVCSQRHILSYTETRRMVQGEGNMHL
jgi:hypothetical protein